MNRILLILAIRFLLSSVGGGKVHAEDNRLRGTWAGIDDDPTHSIVITFGEKSFTEVLVISDESRKAKKEERTLPLSMVFDGSYEVQGGSIKTHVEVEEVYKADSTWQFVIEDGGLFILLVLQDGDGKVLTLLKARVGG